MTVLRLAQLFILFALYALCQSVDATASGTTTLPINASVMSICIGLTATSLIFGNYDPSSNSPTMGNNAISVRCTLNTAFTIALDGGTTTGGSIAQRKMTNGLQTLNYNLYVSPNYADIWGDGLSYSSRLMEGIGSGLTQIFTAYGQIPANQTVPAGTYTDTITVTVNY
jgi:spore coat protein U-like protein